MNETPLQRLRMTGAHLGTWISTGSPAVTELAAGCGFEWLLLDLEHGCGSEDALSVQLLAMKGTNTAAIVRVGAPHPDVILRALDRGADGLMIPRISSAAEADACVRAAWYPPRGHRGVSRTVRAYGYGVRAPASMALVAPPLIMAQIETVDGVDRAAEIAAVDGIDVLFVGPADLKFAIEASGGDPETEFEPRVAAVAAAAASAGKRIGILVRDAAEIKRRLDQGFTMIAVDSDLAILRRGYGELIARQPRS